MAGVVAVPVSAEKKSAKVEKGFVALFDGTTTDQWMNARSGKFPGKGWAIEGDCLKHAAKGGGGDIITRSTYEQFDFRFEWKVAKGANSGVKYFIIRERVQTFGDFDGIFIKSFCLPKFKLINGGTWIEIGAHPPWLCIIPNPGLGYRPLLCPHTKEKKYEESNK